MGRKREKRESEKGGGDSSSTYILMTGNKYLNFHGLILKDSYSLSCSGMSYSW